MRAIYDSDARAAAILLEEDGRQDRTVEVAAGAIVGLRDERVVEVELLGVGAADDVDRLEAVAGSFSLDAEAVVAAFWAAVAAPGRQVDVTVSAPTA